jgi:dihydroflavonol-4-reductase
MPMQCLVTGATGLLGGRIAVGLKQAGHHVRALVRPGSEVAELEKAGVEIFEGQITNLDDVLAAATGCSQIYHNAAVFRTASHPDSYYRDVNVGGTLNVLEAARRQGCERVIHCSTGGVHGHIEHPPADEQYRFQPGDIYQHTKLEAEQAAVAAIRAGQPVAIFRPGAIYGEGDLRFLKLFRAIRAGRFAMIGSGNVRLHMVHIDDCTRGALLCGSQKSAIGETFIIAGPEAPTLNELVGVAAATMKVRRPFVKIPLWPVYAAGWLCEKICVPLGIDPPLHRRRVGFFTHNREFTIQKSRTLLGFDPRVSVREGIARTVAWYTRQGHLEPLAGTPRKVRRAGRLTGALIGWYPFLNEMEVAITSTLTNVGALAAI